LESTRAKEAEVRKETAEQLELFRKQREAAEKAQFEEDGNPNSSSGAAASPHQQTWAARPKKRRRDKEVAPALGAKLRKTSSTELGEAGVLMAKETVSTNDVKMFSTANPSSPEQVNTALHKPPKPPPAATLGLGDYGSDDD
jgi:hypothetical protein